MEPSGLLRALIDISESTTVSTVIDLEGKLLVGIVFPAAFEGTTLTFQVSHDNVTYQALYDDGGTAVSVTTAASRSVGMTAAKAEALAPWRYVKLVAGTAQTVTDRELFVVTKG